MAQATAGKPNTKKKSSREPIADFVESENHAKVTDLLMHLAPANEQETDERLYLFDKNGNQVLL